jgi:hypothetical protein
MDYATGQRTAGPRGAFYNSLTRPPGATGALKGTSSSGGVDDKQSTGSRRADPKIVDRLMSLTNSRNGHVAQAAVRALGSLGMIDQSESYDRGSTSSSALDYHAPPTPEQPKDTSVPLFNEYDPVAMAGADPADVQAVMQSALEYKRAGWNPADMLNDPNLEPKYRELFYKLVNPETIRVDPQRYDPLENRYEGGGVYGMADGGEVPLPEELLGTPEDALLGGMGSGPPPDAMGDEGSVEEIDELMQMLSGGDPMDASGEMVVDPMMGDQAPTDSIPAMVDGQAPVNLDSGEFVIPKDVVMYFGTEKLQKMIDKARQGAGRAPEETPADV